VRRRGDRAARVALTMLLVVPPAAVAAQHARRWADPWNGFAGIHLGQPLDDVVALGAGCWPVLSEQQPNPTFTPERVVQFAFGFALPHTHHDPAAVRAALEHATMCQANLLDERARALILGVDRVVVALTVWFNIQPRPDSLTTDSLRRSLRRSWPGAALAPTLDSWYGQRYRAFYLVPKAATGVPPEFVRPRLILVDIAACTAFERRVHRKAGSGAAEPC
jgi:hypothetical protein